MTAKTIALQQFIEGTVKRTMNHRAPEFGELGIQHPKLRLERALGLAGEAGEVVDLLKKHLCHGRPLDRKKLIGEVGDLAWYITAAAITFFDEDTARDVWEQAATQEMEPGKTLAQVAREMVFEAAFTAKEAPIDDEDGDGAWGLEADQLTTLATCVRWLGQLAPEPFEVAEAWAANEAKHLERHPNGFNPAWKKDIQGDLLKAAKAAVEALNHPPLSFMVKARADLKAAIERAEVAHG